MKEESSMEQTFLTKVDIKKVRHLHDISIPLSNESRKHLLLTGKNGSGKTSVLEALVRHLQFIVSNQYQPEKEIKHSYDLWTIKNEKNKHIMETEQNLIEIQKPKSNMSLYFNLLKQWCEGAVAECTSFATLRDKYQSGRFILAYYGDNRKFQVEKYTHIEKIELEEKYSITDTPGNKLTKYMVDLKATQAFAKNSEKASQINAWFVRFESVLKKIFDDPGLNLEFDEDTFQFTIHETGREPFDFNTMSSGYAAVLDIVNDLIIRMEAQSKLRNNFDLEGVVLIDEIETHLHLELQKKILPMLTDLFPNLQFIISTHSPFILSSLDNAVIYDLEKQILVEKGLKDLPYEGIVEGYFGVDRLGDELRDKLQRYKNLVDKKLVDKNELSDEEYAEIEELESGLDEIPDGLAPAVAAEYSRLKLEFSNRG